MPEYYSPGDELIAEARNNNKISKIRLLHPVVLLALHARRFNLACFIHVKILS